MVDPDWSEPTVKDLGLTWAPDLLCFGFSLRKVGVVVVPASQGDGMREPVQSAWPPVSFQYALAERSREGGPEALGRLPNRGELFWEGSLCTLWAMTQYFL